MVRLHDPRTGELEEIRRGSLRIHVHGDDLRVHVVADLLRRVAERGGHRMLVGRSGPPPSRSLTDFNIQPMQWDPDEADLHVTDAAVPGRCLVVTPATESVADADALAIRLAMLRTRYRAPLHIGQKDVSEAEDQLSRWRGMVAEWANSPGKPLRADHVAEAEAALDDDLDTPAVLSAMDRLAADAEIPPGSKFETFIHLDLILALDLVSAIGGPR
jgi:hypothetical protein